MLPQVPPQEFGSPEEVGVGVGDGVEEPVAVGVAEGVLVGDGVIVEIVKDREQPTRGVRALGLLLGAFGATVVSLN